MKPFSYNIKDPNEKYLINQLVNEKYLMEKISEDGKLVLYNYSDKCIYERKWNSYTLHNRGNVFEIETGKLIAMAFPKFFNFGELVVSKQRNIIKKNNYTITEKIDGSLIIIYYYDGAWRCNTRGSFNSEQSQMATKMLKNYHMEPIPKNLTLLCEIIYPENKIVIDYGKRKDLIILAIYNRDNKKELDREYVLLICDVGKFSIVKEHELTWEETFKFQQTQKLDKEGYVIRFDDGYRIKIKSKKYLEVARIISNLTPLSLWKIMEQGIINEEYLKKIPEEFRDYADELVKKLETDYNYLYKAIMLEYGLVMRTNITRKEIAMNDTLEHKGAVFSVLDKKWHKLNDYIMKRVKTNGSKNS